MNKLTLEYLKTHNACKEGVDFAKRNNLLGFPLDRLDEVEGDFNNFVNWLKGVNKNTYEYDSNGNKTKGVCPNGDTYTWEYDSKGTMIKKVYPDGSTYTYEYTYYSTGSLHTVSSQGDIILVIPNWAAK